MRSIYRNRNGNRTRQAILEFLESNPNTTLKDISDHCDRSLSTVHYHLEILRDEGKVEWRDFSHRTLSLVGESNV